MRYTKTDVRESKICSVCQKPFETFSGKGWCSDLCTRTARKIRRATYMINLRAVRKQEKAWEDGTS